VLEAARTYTEHWAHHRLELLSRFDLASAVDAPARDVGVHWTEPALDELYARSHGYPVFVQAYVSASWRHRRGAVIALDDVTAVGIGVQRTLDESLYDRPFAALSEIEAAYVLALYRLGAGPHRSDEIARELGLASSAAIGSTRARLMKKDVLFAAHALAARVEARAGGFNVGLMPERPCAERPDRLSQRTAERGELVIDARRDRRRDGARHEPVALEAAQREREHALRDAADRALDLTEATRTVGELHDEQHAPLIAHAREDRPDGTAVGRHLLRPGGSLAVPQFHHCHSLRTASRSRILPQEQIHTEGTIMNLLHLDSSITGDESVSRKLSANIVDRFVANGDVRVTYRDLAAKPLGHFTLADFADSTVVDEFLATDIVVIGAPMYNFSIPSQLKAWIDRICIKDKTFRYGATGAEGLCGGKRVVVGIARGGLYGEASGNISAEHAERYLKFVFSFLGIPEIEFVVAEGIAMGPDAKTASMKSANEATEGLNVTV